MISFEKAQSIVQSSCNLMNTEEVELHQLLGRVLAQEVVSDMNMPPFVSCAVGGYAGRRSGIADLLEVVEGVAAGRCPRRAGSSP